MIDQKMYEYGTIPFEVQNNEIVPILIDIAPQAREKMSELGYDPKTTNIGVIKFASAEKDNNIPIQFELEGDGIYCHDKIGYMEDQFQRGIIQWTTVFNFMEIEKMSIVIQPQTSIKIFMWVLVKDYPRQPKPKFYRANSNDFEGCFELLKQKPVIK